MRVVVIALILISILSISPVLAQQNEKSGNNGRGNDKSQSQGEGSQKDNKVNTQETSTSPGSAKSKESSTSASRKTKEASGSAQNCDPNLEWKNHGEYVRCVAQQKLGGQTVSEAARSDVGKKGYVASGSGTPTFSPTPVASDSATPSATPNSTPESTPESTSSGGITETVVEGLKTIQGGITSLGDQVAALLQLLNPFD